jgi:uncharacterized protein
MDDLAFDWDNANVDHIARHRISPREIEQVFANKAVDIDFDMVNGEERWTSIGHTSQLPSWLWSGRCAKNPSGQ